MSISAKRKLAVGAAGLAVLAGSGGAYAAAAGQSAQNAPKPADRAAEQKAFLDDLAKRLNVTRDQLDNAIKGAAEARIDAAVAAGKLTKEQGEAAKKRLAAGAALLPLGPGLLGKPGGPGGPGFGRHGLGFGFDGAADYLGLTEEQIHERLRDGKSLADIAKAQNKDVAGLKAALKANLTEKLDAAVKSGHLTEARKGEILNDVDSRLDAVINADPPQRPDGPKLRWR